MAAYGITGSRNPVRWQPNHPTQRTASGTRCNPSPFNIEYLMKMDLKLVVKNHIKKGTVDLQPAVVMDETQLPEPVHEKIHP